MNDTFIYIEDVLIDLFIGTTIAITLNTINIGDLKTRLANHTNRFKVPKTENNILIFGFADDERSATDVPYRALSCKIIQNGIEIMRGATAIIKESEENFNIEVYSGIFDFFESLGDELISDINTDDINGSFLASDIDAARNSTDGMVTPVMSYGAFTVGSPNNINSDLYLPSLYYKYVINKIASEKGYSLSGNVLSNSRFDKMIIPFSRSSFSYSESFKLRKQFQASAINSQQINLTVGVVEDILFENVIINGSDNFYDGVSRYSPGVLPYFFRHNMNSELNISVVVTGSATIVVRLRANSSTYDSSVVISATGSYYIQLDSTIGVPTGVNEGGGIDPRRVSITQTSGAGSSVVTILSGRFYNEVTDFININNDVFFGNMLPDLKKRDFIKDFFVRWGIVPKESSGTLVLKTISEIINDKSSSIDWTNKRDRSFQDKIEYDFSNYSQDNTIKYSNTDDNLNDDYGTGSFSINSVNTKDNEIFSSPFSSTAMRNIGGIFMALVEVFTDSIVRSEFNNSPGNRILLVRDKYDFEPGVVFNSVERSDYLVAYFDDPQSSNQLNFQEFVDENYTELATALNKAKLITRYYVLNEIDISTIDQHKLIYDDGSYYLWIQVYNFVKGKSTKCILLKVL